MPKRSDLAEAKKAYRIVWKALKAGTLRVALCCERCGKIPRKRNHIHAHHDNYHTPLDVRWLCNKCHKQWHIAAEKLVREFYARPPSQP